MAVRSAQRAWIAAVPVLVLLVGFVVLVSSAVEPAGETDSCPRYTWSPPRALMTADGKLVHVSLPGIARLNEAVFLVGAPTTLSDTSGLQTDAAPDGRSYLAGAVWPFAADTVALLVQPESVGIMHHPMAVEGVGTVDVLWTELDTIPDPPRPKATIWQSTVDTSLMWADPTVVATRDGLAWSLNVYTNAVRLRNQQVKLIVPLQQVFHHEKVMLLTRSASGWSAEEKEVARIGYGGLASVSDSILVLSYVKGASPDRGNTLFVRRSLDAGKSWSDSTRVSPPGEGRVYDARLLASGDSLLYLVWKQQSHDVWTQSLDGSHDSIRLATSRDYGQTWTYHAPLSVGSYISDMTAVVDSFGTPHLIAVASLPGQEHQRLLHAAWSNEEWVTNDQLLGKSVIGSSPWITALFNGEVLIGWGVLAHWNGVPFEPYDGMYERLPNPMPAPATVITRGQRACPSSNLEA